MILTNEEIKRQLRLEDDDISEDVLLSALGAAAESRTSTFLNRPLWVADNPPIGYDAFPLSVLEVQYHTASEVGDLHGVSAQINLGVCRFAGSW